MSDKNYNSAGTDLENVVAVASASHEQVHADIQELNAMLLDSVSLYEKRAKDMCHRFEEGAKTAVNGIRDVSHRLGEYNDHIRTKQSEYQAERAAVVAVLEGGSQVVLNVGGHKFHTSTTTLCNVQGSMLEAMFSGRHPVHAGSDGSYFIDRDCTYFRHILNHLRDGTIPVELTPEEKTAIAREAAFYGLERLSSVLCGDIINYGLNDEILQNQRDETELRRFLQSKTSEVYEERNRYRGLVSVFNTSTASDLLAPPGQDGNDDPNVLLKSWRENRQKAGQCISVSHPCKNLKPNFSVSTQMCLRSCSLIY
jgi:hypothetical protein